MAPDNLDAAVVFSRTSVAQAKLQRLIGKWMPKKETEPEEDIEPEDTKLFVAGPEMSGLGAQTLKDGEAKREQLPSNDKLRQQLLGKDYSKRLDRKKREQEQVASRPQMIGSKNRPMLVKHQPDEESEEEPGRSALGKPSRGQKRRTDLDNEDVENVAERGKEPVRLEGLSQTSKKRRNYLDEVLAERSYKQQKKKREKNGKVEGWTSTVHPKIPIRH